MKQTKLPSTSVTTRALPYVPWLVALCLPLVVDANTSGNLAYCLLWAFSAVGLAAMVGHILHPESNVVPLRSA